MFAWLRTMFGIADPSEVAALREENDALKKASAAGSLFPSNAAGAALGLLGGSDLGRDRERLEHFRGHVFSCVRAIASRVAGQAIRVGRKAKRARGTQASKAYEPHLDRAPGFVRQRAAGGGIDLLDDHELVTALADPNDLMTVWSLLFVTIASLELCGKSYWWITRDADGKESVWPLPSPWVTPLHDRGLFDAYRVQPNNMAAPFVLPGADVLRFHYSDPADPLGSVSPLSRLASAVRADEAVATSQESSFRQGINPGWILTVGKDAQVPGMTSGTGPRLTLTPGQRAQIVHMIRSHHRGVTRHGEPLILDSLIESAVRASLTPVEMDYIASGRMTRERVCLGFGVNEIVLGRVESVNKASSWAAESNFISQTVNPKISLVSQVMTGWFSARYKDPNLVCWVEPCFALDEELELQKILAVADRQGCTINELRQHVMGWGPVTDGERLALPPAKPAAPAKAGRIVLPSDQATNSRH